MKLITFTTFEEADLADKKYLNFLKKEEHSNGGSWSGVMSNGTLFAVLFDDCIYGAMSNAEISRIIDANQDDWKIYSQDVLVD